MISVGCCGRLNPFVNYCLILSGGALYLSTTSELHLDSSFFRGNAAVKGIGGALYFARGSESSTVSTVFEGNVAAR